MAVWLALAAALVIVVSGAILLRRSPQAEPGTDRIVSTNPSAQTAQPARPEPRVWARLGDPPEVRLPASLALAVRGTDKDRDEALEAFGAGITPYREGRFREAADRLAPLAARRPDIPEFAYYLGVARLFAGDPSAAIEPLRQARVSATVGDDARWHEATALERAGRREEADALLKSLCASANSYQSRACAAAGSGS
jgi:predicted Zn-dependent protease